MKLESESESGSSLSCATDLSGLCALRFSSDGPVDLFSFVIGAFSGDGASLGWEVVGLLVEVGREDEMEDKLVLSIEVWSRPRRFVPLLSADAEYTHAMVLVLYRSQPLF